MTKKAQEEAKRGGGYLHVPAQEDEDDIIKEAGAEIDEETGELVVDEEKIRELGAIDPETVRENRRIASVANKQKRGKKRVSFGTDDPLVKYDGLLKSWGPNSIYVTVKRLTGSQVIQQIRSCPRSGMDLYDAVMAIHGQHPEAEYELSFKSTDGHQYRGTGRITLPDTRPPSQQGQPMNHNPYYPPGAPQQASQAGFDPNSFLAMQRQMFEMMQTMQQRTSGAPLAAPSSPPLPVTPGDPNSFLAMQRQLFEMMQMMQAQLSPGAAPIPPMAPPAPSSPLAEQISLFRQLFEMVQAMQPPQAQPRGPARSPYYPQGEPNGRPYYPPQQQPQRQQSPTESFRETMGVVRQALSLRDELDSILPDRHGGHDETRADDENSPIRVVDTGRGKLVYGNEDGALRGWDSFLTNLPEMLKWGGEQMDKISKTAAERQRREQPQQRLPPGYVEVGPDYEPPPGYVAVQVDPSQEELPPPPENIPPPIQSNPSPRGWVIPGSEE
jgi:hypothetical protein